MSDLHRRDVWTWDRTAIRQHQLERLGRLLPVLREHPLYADSLAHFTSPIDSLEVLSELPILEKSAILPDSPAGPSKLFVQPRDRYVRWHQTSGSTGWPLPVMDTAEDWDWWLECWQYVLDAADVTTSDVAMMAFSFGPFIGFWSANDALLRRSVLVVPGGGLSSQARLRLILQQNCSLLCCTPTYAMHLAEVAEQQGVDLAGGPISRIIVAGEPGGSLPSVRSVLEKRFGARVIDHAGASELGAWGFATADGSGLHVIESEFIAETLVFDSDGTVQRRAEPGETAELVLTNLGRFGGPVLRYRTGDLVRAVWDHDLPCRFVSLQGGVLGRADDMLVIRGVNVFPGSVEAILREVEATAEFRVIVSRREAMDQIRVEVEASEDAVRQLETRFRDRLAMRVPVAAVPAGSLPRFEAKARRWIDRREEAADR